MYQFYLDGVMLPVAPAKMTTKIKNQNKTKKIEKNYLQKQKR